MLRLKRFWYYFFPAILSILLIVFVTLFLISWRRKKNSQERPRWIFAFDKPRKSMKNYSNANREGNRAADSAL